MLLYKFNSQRTEETNELSFKDGSKITQITPTSIVIKIGNETLSYSEEGKPEFKNDKGESVIEYSGLATDGKSECSWAIAKFDPKGVSSLHFHNERTENYYVLSGKAKILLDGKEHILTAGDHLEILTRQQHQVINESDKEKLALVVKCEPAWIFQDSHVVNADNFQSVKPLKPFN
jgi:mannose-6-phosphate isomerase-like protein (cupin superfamily)